jgi:hypothetical protein
VTTWLIGPKTDMVEGEENVIGKKTMMVKVNE